jgi:3-isopropylmalate dehydratase small subunit
MIFKGKVWKFGNDINTDLIIPARYLNTTNPQELAKHVMEDEDKDFPQKVRVGDMIVSGKNFGCGSSREHAPIAIKGAGISAVISESFARIFYRNAFNMGLPIFESIEAARDIDIGDEIEVNPAAGTIVNLTKGKTYTSKPIPPFMESLIAAGGLIQWTKQRIKEATSNVQ